MMRIDFHAHCFPPRFCEDREALLVRDATFRELYSDAGARMATAEDLLAAMDLAEIDVGVIMNLGWNDREVAREANDYVADVVARYPGRLVGFGGVNPAWGDYAAREAERCAAVGLRGLGELHPDTQGFRLDQHEVLGPVMEVAERLGLIVLTHTSEPVGHTYAGKGHTTPEQALALAEKFPDVTLVYAHWGGGLPFYGLMPEVGTVLSRVYFDSAASPFLYDPRIFDIVTRLVGVEHVLFGTDFPLIGHRRLLAQVERSGLSLEQQSLVLGGNAARLLGLV